MAPTLAADVAVGRGELFGVVTRTAAWRAGLSKSSSTMALSSNVLKTRFSTPDCWVH
jgi:hypothetical protein